MSRPDYEQLLAVYDVARSVVETRDAYDEGEATDEEFLDAMAELESVVNDVKEEEEDGS